jgi:TPR repeat protein
MRSSSSSLAARYFKLAADQAHALAIGPDGATEAANMIHTVNALKISADDGEARAQYAYAVALHKGQGVLKNIAEAARYFKMAADRGNADAQYNYGGISGMARACKWTSSKQ